MASWPSLACQRHQLGVAGGIWLKAGSAKRRLNVWLAAGISMAASAGVASCGSARQLSHQWLALMWRKRKALSLIAAAAGWRNGNGGNGV